MQHNSSRLPLITRSKTWLAAGTLETTNNKLLGHGGPRQQLPITINYAFKNMSCGRHAPYYQKQHAWTQMCDTTAPDYQLMRVRKHDLRQARSILPTNTMFGHGGATQQLQITIKYMFENMTCGRQAPSCQPTSAWSRRCDTTAPYYQYICV